MLTLLIGMGQGDLLLVLGDAFGAMVFCGAIYGASRTHTGALGRILHSATIRYVGKTYLSNPSTRGSGVSSRRTAESIQ